MEYCRYCNESRERIELRDIRVCIDSPDGEHRYTTKSYDAGYAFGEYVVDKVTKIFRSLFSRK